MRNPFTEHPSSVGETYLEHARFAFCCGSKLLILGMMAITHALLPFLFVHTTSQKLDELCLDMKARKTTEE